MSRHHERQLDKSPARRAPASDPKGSRASLNDSNQEDDDLVPRDRRHVNPIFQRSEGHEVNDSVPEDESHYKVESKRPTSRSRTRVDEVADEFARTVPLNNMPACKSFIIKNPNLLREVDLDDKYLIPAIQALAIGTDASRLSAWSYMEKYTVINCVKNYHSRGKGSFLDIFIKNDSSAKELMKTKFGAVKVDCEKRAQRKAPEPSDRHPMQNSSSREVPKLTKDVSELTLGRRETEHLEHSTPHSKDPDRHKDSRGAKPKGSERATQRVEYSSHSIGFDRHKDPPGARSKGVERAARPVEYTSYDTGVNRHKDPPGTKLKDFERADEDKAHDATLKSTPPKISRRHTATGPRPHELGRESDIPEETSDMQATGTRARAPSGSTLDFRFQALPSHRWEWFKIGCVFAMKLYSENSSREDDFSETGLRNKQGVPVFIKVRRLVVVRTKDAFCYAVPILTYGGKGLNKPAFRKSNIEAHARIHMENCEPRWLDTQGNLEPRTGKTDMVVRPTSDNALPLEDASRICFERTYSIDYNERILKVGRITDECIPYLVGYWEEEIKKQSDHSRPRKDEGAHDTRPSGQRRR